jgi:phage shock protein PspC (stress-responsive transcriptional regulator)
MQKVITINLNGNAYQLDERGYDALVAYLEHAERQLAGNPDRAEVLADLEQAIADKCMRVLGANKSVVTAAEVEQIIKEMGPVESTDPAAGGSSAGTGDSAGTGGGTGTTRDRGPRHRRLYLIHEGAMVGGVCTGLAAYIGIDVTIVRIGFLVFAVLTKGFGILAYLVLMFVIPSANTSEEQAAAHGEPFNAQELVDRAKRQYSQFRGSDWKGRWRQQRREWRRQARYARRAHPWWFYGAPMPPPAGYMTRMGAGLMVPILSFATAALFWVFAYVCLSLFLRQEVFGEPLPPEMPIWVGLLIVTIAYAAVSWPLHAMQRASYVAISGYNHGMVAAWGGLLSAGFGILIVWAAYQSSPEVRELVRSLPLVWDGVRELAR